MSEQQVLELLRNAEFFRGMADDHLERLAGISNFVEFPAHVDIFREHEPAENVYVIMSGEVSLVICTPKVGCRQLMIVHPGELISWSPLVGRTRLTDTAHTLEPTSAISIDGGRILALCGEHPEFGFEFMHRAAKALAGRLSATRLQLLDFCGVSLPEYQIESD